MAMTAARLGDAELAVRFLTPKNAKNFEFGIAGMTPRIHVVDDAATLAAGTEDGAGFRRAAETYFPSNGALLLAVGLMAAGDQGANGEKPSGPLFPSDWHVRSEGLVPMP
jgi:hypothetical protein